MNKLIDMIDDDTRHNLLRLQQKMKGLDAEIKMKLESSLEEAEDPEKYRKMLQKLAFEVDTAIDRIEAMMSVDIDEDDAGALQDDDVNELSTKIEMNLKKISQLREKF